MVSYAEPNYGEPQRLTQAGYSHAVTLNEVKKYSKISFLIFCNIATMCIYFERSSVKVRELSYAVRVTSDLLKDVLNILRRSDNKLTSCCILKHYAIFIPVMNLSG